jgi:intracellular multiplication protein IcmW
MPDLSREAVHEFWSRYQDPNVYRVITFMEGVETWTADGNNEVESALQKLGQELDNLAGVDLGQLGQQELFIKIACHVKAARVTPLILVQRQNY